MTSLSGTHLTLSLSLNRRIGGHRKDSVFCKKERVETPQEAWFIHTHREGEGDGERALKRMVGEGDRQRELFPVLAARHTTRLPQTRSRSSHFDSLGYHVSGASH